MLQFMHHSESYYTQQQNNTTKSLSLFVHHFEHILHRADVLICFSSTQIAPNLQALIGDFVGARLISHAGSLTNLAKYPASTVQILGAEKALFRALKTKGNTPKYGLIFHSPFIGKASSRNKGRISRYLNKCSMPHESIVCGHTNFLVRRKLKSKWKALRILRRECTKT